MKKIVSILAISAMLTGCEEQPSKTPIKQTSIKEAEQQNKEDELALEATYFNEVQEVDGENVIINSENRLALVNKTFVLPETYEPEDLVQPNVTFSFGDEDVEKSYLRKEAAQALEEMFEAAKEDHIHLFAASGYRSYSRQQAVLQNKINRDGEEEAVQVVAIPGQSEHQTGLAMDITGEGVQYQLIEEFGEQPEGIWLADNAHLYGFILRYPQEKETITGYNYEPWHFRYVGKKEANIIYENNWTLEEFFQHVKKM